MICNQGGAQAQQAVLFSLLCVFLFLVPLPCLGLPCSAVNSGFFAPFVSVFVLLVVLLCVLFFSVFVLLGFGVVLW